VKVDHSSRHEDLEKEDDEIAGNYDGEESTEEK